MRRGFLILDIETVPDPALYSPPASGPGAERPFPPPFAHRPIALGVLWLDEAFAFQRLGIIGEGKEEPEQLADFARFVGDKQPTLVTYNGRGFDLPVLGLRCLRWGVPLPFKYDDGFAHRYRQGGHIDLCDLLSDHGATRSMKLDDVAKLIGLPGKVGVDGSQVEALYNSGQLELIKNYCLSDVVQTAFLLLRFRLLQGLLALETYRTVAAALLERLLPDPRLAPLMERIDRPRLLLS